MSSSINKTISLLRQLNQWNCISFSLWNFLHVSIIAASREKTMNNDQIVSDLISLIHSTTQSNYVLCSQISSKIVAYFSRISFVPNSWEELSQAIEVKFFLGTNEHFSLIFFLEIRSKFRSSRPAIFPTIASNHQYLFEWLWRTKLYTRTRWNDSQRFD